MLNIALVKTRQVCMCINHSDERWRMAGAGIDKTRERLPLLVRLTIGISLVWPVGNRHISVYFGRLETNQEVAVGLLHDGY